MHDVAIVGAGVAGLSMARALARVGWDVVVLERSADGDGCSCGGASSLPVALLNPWRGRKGDAHPDDLAGLKAVWRWADELQREGLSGQAHRSGVLRVATSERQARTWRERAGQAASLAWLDRDEVPGYVSAPFGAVRVIDGGWLRAPAWLSALAESTRAHGATLRSGAEVQRIARSGDAWRLALRSGEDALARIVVLAVGADEPPGLDGARGAIPPWPDWVRTRGESVEFQATDSETGVDMPMPVAGAVYVVSDRTRSWVGGGHRPPESHDASVAETLRASAAWVRPDLADASPAAVWCGVRAKREDARPEVRELTEGVWIFGAFAGRGFLCAADQAERLTRRLS